MALKRILPILVLFAILLPLVTEASRELTENPQVKDSKFWWPSYCLKPSPKTFSICSECRIYCQSKHFFYWPVCYPRCCKCT